MSGGYTPQNLIHSLKELLHFATSPEPVGVYGLMAEFANADDVVTAARKVRAAGYRKVDGYSPYPMESLIHELDQHHSWVPTIVLGGGLTGFLAGYGLEYWSSVIAYPMNIGGRPFHSWVSFIPPAFETTILFASFGAVFGMLALNGFPKPYHPVFNIEEFAKSASNDKFYLVIEAGDPQYDAAKTAELLKSLNPTFVKEIPRVKRFSLLVLASAVMLLGAACRQDMHDQPKAKPQSKSAFFVDGRTGRLPVEGTVARGELREDDHLYRGKVDGVFVTTFPFKIDAALLERGRERYTIYCTPCHGQTGLGDGLVIQRGFKVPAASHHIQRLREAPVGYWFDVITNGFGVMYGYAAQVPVKDRWAIIAYVRALQLSRNATLEDIPEAEREAVLSGRKPAGEGLHVAPPPGEAGHTTPSSESAPKSPETKH